MSSCPDRPTQRPRIALQLYSLKRASERDVAAALKLARQLGVEGVEFAGLYDRTPRELRALCADQGLCPVGCHMEWHMMGEGRDRVQRAIDQCHEMGVGYLVCNSLPWSMMESRDAWVRTAGEFTRIGELAAAAGISLAYHNYSIEMQEFDGEPGLAIFYRHADPRFVRMELDVGWCDVTGRTSSLDFMREFSDSLELLHIKEITGIGDPTARVLGQGAMDLPAICALGRSQNVPWYIVEHEGDEEDPLDLLAAGVQYLKSLLSR
jgi:sugar phosphate isomerase/epimerase